MVCLLCDFKILLLQSLIRVTTAKQASRQKPTAETFSDTPLPAQSTVVIRLLATALQKVLATNCKIFFFVSDYLTLISSFFFI